MYKRQLPVLAIIISNTNKHDNTTNKYYSEEDDDEEQEKDRNNYIEGAISPPTGFLAVTKTVN